MCRLNPWSQGLYNRRVNQLIGNAFDLVKTFPDGAYDRIVHDPPTFALAGIPKRILAVKTLDGIFHAYPGLVT